VTVIGVGRAMADTISRAGFEIDRNYETENRSVRRGGGT
jgi:hypothetical protein